MPNNNFGKFGDNPMKNIQITELTKVTCIILTKSRAITQVSDVIWLVIRHGQDFTHINILCNFSEDPMKNV